jgi:hypothetical protein
MDLTTRKTRHFNITTLPPINYMSSDCIMIWSVCRLCSSSSCFTSRSQICDPTNICWVTIDNPPISPKNLPVFHSHSTNISQIANRKAGGELAARSEQSTYWLCHDTMRTEILIWRQKCRYCKVAHAVRFQPGRNTTGLCLVWVTNPPKQILSGFGSGLEPNRTKPRTKNWTAGGFPGHVGNTNFWYPPYS